MTEVPDFIFKHCVGRTLLERSKVVLTKDFSEACLTLLMPTNP